MHTGGGARAAELEGAVVVVLVLFVVHRGGDQPLYIKHTHLRIESRKLFYFKSIFSELKKEAPANDLECFSN